MADDETDAVKSKSDASSYYSNATKKVESSKGPAVVTPIYSDFYNTSHYQRGRCIIFNQKEFDDKSMRPRDGTDRDAESLKVTFENYGFSVKQYDDLKYGEIYDVLDEVAQEDHSQSSCLIIAVMSHGESGYIHSKDHKYKPETLWTPFTGDKCETLVGKPKIFFIQACRGDEVDDGAKVVGRSLIQKDANASGSYTIPVMADILVMYSTYEGHYSWRNPTSGSWFIQSLCDELMQHGEKKDLVTILTFVNRRMAVGFESNVPGNSGMHKKKQIGSIVSTLTRRFYLYPK